MEGCSSTEGEIFDHYKPSPTQHDKSYHVFLSFEGEVIRKTLVDHLFESLSCAGFRVFLDKERLEKEENIEVRLGEAIRNSTVHIPIFSADYASSACCLKELSLIWTCKSKCAGTTIIPLFYNVEPSDVRYPDKKGPYAEAFQKHEKEGRSEEEMGEWKEALRQVSLLSGWSLATTAGGYEGRLVKLVVMDLLKTLNINSLDVAKHPEGLSDRMEEVASLLEMNDHSHVRGVAIWGMGGLGKTTLAKAVYNNIHSRFQSSCFVSDVRASAKESVKGLLKLQKQILRDLVQVDESTLKNLNSVSSAKIQMENLLRSIKALVILDDVDDEDQLDALVGDAFKGYWFEAGSRIIITTRDSEILTRQIHVIRYSMRGLDPREGLGLFSWHAFMRTGPAKGYEDITEKIVDACQGLPLSLEVVGAHLYGKERLEIWREALNNLVKVHQKVYNTLKISYDALRKEEKRMFLDIACFFMDPLYFGPLYASIYDRDRPDVTRYDVLEFFVKLWKSLGCTTPHTCLRNLEGKSLIRINSHSYHNRDSVFWMHDHVRDLARQIVQEECQNNPAERTRFWRYKDLVSAVAQKQGMPKVEGLLLDFSEEVEEEEYLDQTYPWELMQNLKFMFIGYLCHDGRRTILPQNILFWGLTDCNFQKDESGEEDETASKTQPNSFSLLKAIGQLRHLPNELGELLNLEELNLSGCGLTELPQWLSNLVKLETLDVSRNSLSSFPANFHQLKSLVILSANRNFKIQELSALPSSLCVLDLHSSYLQKMSSISHLKKLEVLDVSDCISLGKLPSMDSMHSLKYLKLEGCVELQELPALPDNFSYLSLSGCHRLQEVSSISHLKKMEVLDVSDCRSLRKLPSLDSMHSLKDLKLMGCAELQELSGLPDNLSYLSLSGCHRLQEVSSISHLKKLEVLDVSNCKSLRKLPSLDYTYCLKDLKLMGCVELQDGFLNLNLKLQMGVASEPISTYNGKHKIPDPHDILALSLSLPDLECPHVTEVSGCILSGTELEVNEEEMNIAQPYLFLDVQGEAYTPHRESLIDVSTDSLVLSLGSPSRSITTDKWKRKNPETDDIIALSLALPNPKRLQLSEVNEEGTSATEDDMDWDGLGEAPLPPPPAINTCG